MAAAESLANDIKNLQVNDGQTNDQTGDRQPDAVEQQWGFTLDELYKIALKFFKEKEGKALQLTYQDKLRMVAYTKQVAHGKYTPDASPDVGFLDVVGNDRRLENSRGFMTTYLHTKRENSWLSSSQMRGRTIVVLS